MTFEQRLEGGEGGSQVEAIWGKASLAKGTASTNVLRQEQPGVFEEVSVAPLEGVKGEGDEGNDITEETGQMSEALVGPSGDFGA